MWSDERDTIMDLLDDTEKIFPAKCPCCGENEGHIFFYKHNECDRLGSAWAWCSSCKEFSHSRHIIPDWWKNMNEIGLNQLNAEPDNLDALKCEIDDWVNKIKKEI